MVFTCICVCACVCVFVCTYICISHTHAHTPGLLFTNVLFQIITFIVYLVCALKWPMTQKHIYSYTYVVTLCGPACGWVWVINDALVCFTVRQSALSSWRYSVYKQQNPQYTKSANCLRLNGDALYSRTVKLVVESIRLPETTWSKDKCVAVRLRCVCVFTYIYVCVCVCVC